MKHLIFLFNLLMVSTSLLAQHCPFDGTHLIAIKLVDKNGKMVTKLNASFYLVESDNPMADSCTSNAGLIKKQFLQIDSFTTAINNKFNRNSYSTQLISRLTKAGVFANASFLLTINQTENTCILIGKSETVYTNYIYRQRKFEIVYMLNGKEIREPLPDRVIYALCTNAKEIEKFKPLIIKL